MKSIYKYELGGGLNILKGCFKKFLDIKNQNGTIVIWAEIDEEKCPWQEVIIWGLGTGWELDDMEEDFQNSALWEYIGTEIDDANYVWHFYLKRPGGKILDAVMKSLF
jgi:hypothetical protein